MVMVYCGVVEMLPLRSFQLSWIMQHVRGRFPGCSWYRSSLHVERHDGGTLQWSVRLLENTVGPGCRPDSKYLTFIHAFGGCNLRSGKAINLETNRKKKKYYSSRCSRSFSGEEFYTWSNRRCWSEIVCFIVWWKRFWQFVSAGR